VPPQLSLPGTASIPLHFGCTVCVLYWANYGILLQAVYCTKPITESCCRQCLRPGSPATQKSPPNNIVVAQRAFLCLLLLTNNQSPGPGALKWETFFDRQFLIQFIRYHSSNLSGIVSKQYQSISPVSWSPVFMRVSGFLQIIRTLSLRAPA